MKGSELNTVEIRNLSFGWGNRVIFDNVSIDIPTGKVTAIMGPSGSGKTTLLRLIGGQLLPQSGSIIANGFNIPELGRTELYQARRQMGMLFQSGALFSDLTVFDNVAFPLREHTNLPESFIHDIVLMKLEAVGLRGARNLMPSELSGGMQRRAALARTIALDPNLLMFDEPFAGQDPISMGILVKLIRLLNDALGVTSIIVSHDVPETCSIADYVYVIANGKVIGHGSPESIKNSDSRWVHQFMCGLPDGPVPFHYPAKNYQQDLLGG
ncbi:ATP-binding cassette domain-containing protein [Candidatus Berkiella aquae]|uniref:ATP-binding cassette domain-containing protein n=1 Tax=Candidatus Berkiella aquae TaxID=295108 RepID=A0A0Q9YJ65_9GAMM|nr:ATP-binding cassette domain-containing protein [Candidatus Berkiella aquae]MCS5710733.1 ATP-binding cassette domain-containing protein [Candidatus Berkiella aquae]